MDPFSDVLSSIRFQSAIYAQAEFTAPWGFTLPSFPTHMSFFMVMRGSCVATLTDRNSSYALAGGELLLLPRRGDCILQDAAGSPLFPFEKMQEEQAKGKRLIRMGGPGALTSLVMGCFVLEAHQRNPFIASLPDVIYLTAENVQSEPGLETTIRLLYTEISRNAQGTDILIQRLTDALFIQIIRAYISQIKRCPETPGWLKALSDPEIGAALNLIHEKPEAPWTVASLADAVNMSRTSFANKFTALVTYTPIDYLTLWRMQKAIGMMQVGNDSLAEIGSSVGYTSMAAFAKAFKRELGESPSEFRKKYALELNAVNA